MSIDAKVWPDGQGPARNIIRGLVPNSIVKVFHSRCNMGDNIMNGQEFYPSEWETYNEK